MTNKTISAKNSLETLTLAIVDGLEDVKAVDIQVFDTTNMTSLFERVIIASGSSSRQTKALAVSIKDAVREAGFPLPKIGGEQNGEWITVDCGMAVAHIFQPAYRQYYNLEGIWGEVPVEVKSESKKAFENRKQIAAEKAEKKVISTAVKKPRAPAKKTVAKKVVAKKIAVKKTAAKKSTVKAKGSVKTIKVATKKAATVKKSTTKQVVKRASPEV